jgi:hypothetical protein
MLETPDFGFFTKFYLSHQFGSLAWNAKRSLQPPDTALTPAANGGPDAR